MGEGSNVCNRGREQESPTASLSQGSLSSMTLAKAPVRGARKDKIEFVVTFGANSCILPQLILFVHSDL